MGEYYTTGSGNPLWYDSGPQGYSGYQGGHRPVAVMRIDDITRLDEVIAEPLYRRVMKVPVEELFPLCSGDEESGGFEKRLEYYAKSRMIRYREDAREGVYVFSPDWQAISKGKPAVYEPPPKVVTQYRDRDNPQLVEWCEAMVLQFKENNPDGFMHWMQKIAERVGVELFDGFFGKVYLKEEGDVEKWLRILPEAALVGGGFTVGVVVILLIIWII